MLVAGEGQAPLLQLLHDELPPADGLLAVDRGDAAGGHRDVGELELAALLDDLVDLLGRLGADEDAQQLADGLGPRELGVVDSVAGQLEDALADL